MTGESWPLSCNLVHYQDGSLWVRSVYDGGRVVLDLVRPSYPTGYGMVSQLPLAPLMPDFWFEVGLKRGQNECRLCWSNIIAPELADLAPGCCLSCFGRVPQVILEALTEEGDQVGWHIKEKLERLGRLAELESCRAWTRELGRAVVPGQGVDAVGLLRHQSAKGGQ